MATNYPTSLDNATSLPYPAATNPRNNPSLAGLQDNQNDAVIAAQTKLGTGSSTPTSGKLLRGTGTGSSAWDKDAPTGTIVGTSDSQTLTNKTLTSPTINSPTINNATISSDAYTGYTVSNTGSIYGVNITTGKLAAASASGGFTVTGGLTVDTLNVGSYTTSGDWALLATAPNTVTANGNRSYSLVFNSVDYTSLLNPGTRVRTTRTVAAPNQSALFNGTTQYLSRASASLNGMTFTSTFTLSAWVKMTSYPTNYGAIVARSDATSANAWFLDVNPSGQARIGVYNAGSANYRIIASYQSLPLNKWVHVAASYNAGTVVMYFDGVSVPVAAAVTGGTAPTACVQAGDLGIGRFGSLTTNEYFPGYISQVAIYSAVISQANIVATMSQGLAGTETSLVSAYSLSNSLNDLNANGNNLTANNSVVTTNADSPFGGQGNGNISTTLDYGIVQLASFSTNTTVVVQVSEGCTIPTTGGVSAFYYSSYKAPYGMPTAANKWELIYLRKDNVNTGSIASSSTVTNMPGYSFVVPVGYFDIYYNLYGPCTVAVAAAYLGQLVGISTANNSFTDFDLVSQNTTSNASTTENDSNYTKQKSLALTTATTYYVNTRGNINNVTQYLQGTNVNNIVRYIPSNL